MVTAEMRNSMLRDQIFNDLADIKKEMFKVNVELELLKALVAEIKDDRRS